MEFTVQFGEPDVTHRISWPERTGDCSGRSKVFGQLQKEANATLVGTKQDSNLLANACIEGAIKQCCSFPTAFMLQWQQVR